MTSMNRPNIDIAQMLANVVAPVLVAVARPGEVESLVLAWQPELGPTGLPLELRLTTTMAGETFHISMWNVGEPVLSDADARERLASYLQDFIAESHFGRGELRAYPTT